MNQPLLGQPKNVGASPLKISVIIPVLNEANRVAAAVEGAWNFGANEVIVVDGGSTDQTAELANAADCVFCQSDSGRGLQLNAGAAKATGDVLLFLHVDNWFETDITGQIRKALRDESCCGGGFHQRIQSQRSIFRLIEYGNSFRARIQGLVYGDQGLFVRKKTFDQLGGFPEIPLMEDFEFSRRLFKGPHKPVLLAGPIHVSSRRWDQQGVIKQTIKNWRIAADYRRGASSVDLYHRYYND